jgi:DNA-binding IclR family transcriptional regulator
MEKLLPKGNVPSVNKAVQILDAVAAANNALSLAELTETLKLPKSSVLAICSSLSRNGLLKRLDNGSYRLGTHVLDLAYAYLSNISLTQEFLNVMETFGGLPGEGIVLAVLDGADIVYVACRNSDAMVGVTYRIGTRLPASCTATGKALLSTFTDEEVQALYKKVSMIQLTSKSHKEVGTLLKDLHGVRLRGFAVDDEESHMGLFCIGAPIFDASGSHAIAAVAVSSLHRPTRIHQHPAIPTVLEFSDILSRRLGAVPRSREKVGVNI